MSHEQGEAYGYCDLAAKNAVAAATLSSRSELPGALRKAHGEIDSLRSINAHLVRQVAELKQRVAHAQRLADRDGLTGLYNRRKMGDLLEGALADASRQGGRVGLLFIDLDGFKDVNDHYGHAAGDQLLTTVAARIAARTRAGDCVCRYGGDEFVVILPQVADAAALRQVADSIARRVALPYRVDGMVLQVTAAIGAAMYPDQAGSAAALMQIADESMYRAKLERTDRFDVLCPAPARRRDDESPKRHWLDAL